MNPVLQNDIIVLGFIFGVLIIICLVLAWINNREERTDMCEACGGDEFIDVIPGHGLIGNRMVMRCHDCKRTREISDGEL